MPRRTARVQVTTSAGRLRTAVDVELMYRWTLCRHIRVVAPLGFQLPSYELERSQNAVPISLGELNRGLFGAQVTPAQAVYGGV